MAPDSTPDPSPSERSSDGFGTVMNGLVGGVAGVFLSFIPMAAVLGGVVAGYLEGGEPSDGLKPGAIAGLVMLLPVSGILFFLLFVLGISGAPAAFGVLGVLVVLFSAVYTVGLGILGGYLGVYLKNEL